MLSSNDGDADGHGHSHDHDHAAHSHSHSHSHGQSSTAVSNGSGDGDEPPKASQGENDLAQDKVRSTIRSLVRDWAEEGKPERDACYTPILEALERSFPETSDRTRSSRKVLVPGCGLGRLAMEIAARGRYSRLASAQRFKPATQLMMQASPHRAMSSPHTCFSHPISCSTTPTRPLLTRSSPTCIPTPITRRWSITSSNES